VELKNLPPEEGETLGTWICWCTWATQNFVYQIWPQQYSVPGFTYRRAAEIDLLPA
jgi:choline/glycine/proline betaine transport protein